VARVGHRLPAAHARLVIEAEGYEVRSVTGATVPCGEASNTEPREDATADIALFQPAGQERQCVLGIRGGRIVFDGAGLSIPDVSRAGPYTNFK
jgi:hypothetical protein